jgi:hypothetical protein
MDAAAAWTVLFVKTHLRDFGHILVKASNGQKSRKNRGLLENASLGQVYPKSPRQNNLRICESGKYHGVFAVPAQPACLKMSLAD